jgi:membrane protein involved in colicin uptake
MPDTTDTATVPTQADDVITPEAESKPDEPLGDAGKRALEAERESRKDAEARAKAAERALREATTEREKAIAEAKAEARREILEEANTRLLRAEIKAAATGKLANPELAVKLLDLSTFTVADDGTVEVKAITTAIDKLLETDPYLKASTLTGSADGGRQGEPAPSKLDMNTLIRAAAKQG